MIHIIFTSEDKENSVYGWEEFPISDIHAPRDYSKETLT